MVSDDPIPSDALHKDVEEQTFIEPPWFGQLIKCLGRNGIVVLQGPRRCGKKETLRYALRQLKQNGDERKLIEWNAAIREPEESLEWRLKRWSPDKILVLKEFQQIEDKEQRANQALLKEAADNCTVVILGTPQAGEERLIQKADPGKIHDMFNDFNAPSDEEISEILVRRERLTNVSLEPFGGAKLLASLVHGSYFVAQRLFEAATELTPDSKDQKIAVKPLMDATLNKVDFTTEVKEIAKMDADAGCGSPGACVVLLYHLGALAAGKHKLDIQEISGRYPYLKESFKWVSDGGLGNEIKKSPELRYIIHATRGFVESKDARLRFFLANSHATSYEQIARDVGAHVRFESDPERGSYVQPRLPPESRSEVRIWENPHLLHLHDGLVENLDTARAVKMLAKQVGIKGVGLINDNYAGIACGEMLEQAFREERMPQLLEQALISERNLEKRIREYARSVSIKLPEPPAT